MTKPGTTRRARSAVPNKPYSLRILDDSMAPALPRGGIIFVDDTSRRAVDHTVVIWFKNGTRLVRRLVRADFFTW
jgi:phage repressor protein C with HTH and peptisase S24 domain